MGAEDMDKNECDMIKGSNGLLRADFNGDGVDDFAVLLRSKNSHRRENGDLYRYQVVAFISGKDKKHEPKVLTENEDFYPPITFITIRKPGKIREFETGKTTAIKNPAIDLTYCGKSSVTYLWKGKKFSEIWTSD